MNIHDLTRIHNYYTSFRSEKACTNSFSWTRLLIVVLNSSLWDHILRHHGYPTPYLNDCFSQTKYKTSTIVSYKHAALSIAISRMFSSSLFSINTSYVYKRMCVSVCVYVCVSNSDKCMHNRTFYIIILFC